MRINDGAVRPAVQESLTTWVAGHVLVMTINRPNRRNAIDLATAEAISVALDTFENSPDLRCAIITGSGPTFCAGMDLKALAATGERPITTERGAFGFVGRRVTKPIIAAVSGHVLGGGLEIAIACDLIVSSKDAQFGLPEVRRGQVAAAGGAVRLAGRIPIQVASEMLLTGAPITARRAYEIGLVCRLADDEEVFETALGIADVISSNAPLAVSVSKQLLHESLDWPTDRALHLQEDLVNVVRGSRDAAEGATAFAERRTPNWSGT